MSEEIVKLQSNAASIMQKYSVRANKRLKSAASRARNKIQDRRPIVQPRILIIDGSNLYLRRFSVHQNDRQDKQLTNRNGQQTGAVFTMIQMLNKLCSTFKSTHCFVCWQGYNSKKKRLQVNAQYKSNRVFKKSRSFIPQLKRTQRYLNLLPLVQMKIDFAEADDLIALLVRQYPKHQKIIVSQDRDFVQLINDQNRVKLFLPMKKLLLDQKRAIQKYGCHPKNFVYQKAILGDGSDNINGIRGIGPKTIAKQLGKVLIEQKIESLRHLTGFAGQKMKNLILQNVQMLNDNLSIMDLSKNMQLLSLDVITRFKQLINNKKCSLDNSGLRVFMRHDGFYGESISKIVKNFSIMSYLNKKWNLERKNENDDIGIETKAIDALGEKTTCIEKENSKIESKIDERLVVEIV